MLVNQHQTWLGRRFSPSSPWFDAPTRRSFLSLSSPPSHFPRPFTTTRVSGTSDLDIEFSRSSDPHRQRDEPWSAGNQHGLLEANFSSASCGSMRFIRHPLVRFFFDRMCGGTFYCRDSFSFFVRIYGSLISCSHRRPWSIRPVPIAQRASNNTMVPNTSR